MVAPFEAIDTVKQPSWVSDPEGKRSALLRMECGQNDHRSELRQSSSAYNLRAGNEAWLCVEYYVDAMAIDPNWHTMSQIHYAATASAVDGSPMSQACARTGNNLITSLRPNPSAGQWGGADIHLMTIPSRGRIYIVHHAIGGQKIEMWASSTAPAAQPTMIVSQNMSWASDVLCWGLQVGVYRGTSQTSPSVVYVAGVGWAGTYAQAAQNAGWTATAPPPPPPSTAPTAQQTWDAFSASSYFQKWMTSYPSEVPSVKAYWLGTGPKVSVFSKFGQALVLEAARASA